MPKKEINLLPREDFEKRTIGKLLIWILTVGRWIVIVIELIVITAFLSRFKLDRDLANLYESIRAKQAIIQSSSSFEKDFRLFQSRVLMTGKLVKGQLKVVDIVSAVSAVTPVEVALDNLAYEDGEIRMSGLALSEMGLKIFTSQLSLSSHFSDINLSNITKKAEESGGIKFNLSAEVKKQEGQK